MAGHDREGVDMDTQLFVDQQDAVVQARALEARLPDLDVLGKSPPANATSSRRRSRRFARRASSSA